MRKRIAKEERKGRVTDITRLPRITLTDRQRFDLEQILCGGFAPLKGFLNEKDYISVVERMRLSDGTLWPIPIVLDVPEVEGRKIGDRFILCDVFGNPISFFTIESIYSPDKKKEARMVYGTEDRTHPGVQYLMAETGKVYLGGPVELIKYAPTHDFSELRRRPEELKQVFKERGWKKVVAFQTRNPMHRAHFELVRRAAEMHGAKALVQPVVGLTKEGDIDYISRVRSYKRLVENRMSDFAMLSLLPIAMRMAGPREAIWHAIIRKNYGATHFIVGRDHAGPGKDASGKPFYEPYAAQELAKKHEQDTGIVIVPMKEYAYVESEDAYLSADELKPGQVTKNISGTEFRKMLRDEEKIPEWFSFPEVVDELRIAVRKEKRRGGTIFFTGLSGAGKSTIAHVLYHKLLERQERSVTLLDGDVVRQNLSRGLGFSREDRNANIERIGFVAGEISKHGGIAICAAIAPYREPRDNNRRRIEKVGQYIEVYVKAPLEVCELRDTKGLYAKARAGLLPHFTGIDDPYETPEHPELVLDTTALSAEESAEKVYDLLCERGLIDLQV
ncbi:MAG TPA: bifunctional sulfate adenylyltransferase/adenylylsulfate kinase [Candidatus Paceibacterota bacterium]|nr:bifunctional sulfate adenylyltransferase/adenylylsulfate kinase [Candidatus Paceibacterota bacterium]